jgi:hypothetical protein
MDRVLQCVSPGGVVSSVFTMMASTWSSDTVRGAPTRGSSSSPSSRRSTNWPRHFATVVFVVRKRRATAVSDESRHANTIRARNAKWRLMRARFVSRMSAARSSSVTATSARGRPIFGMPLLDPKSGLSPSDFVSRGLGGSPSKTTSNRGDAIRAQLVTVAGNVRPKSAVRNTRRALAASCSGLRSSSQTLGS